MSERKNIQEKEEILGLEYILKYIGKTFLLQHDDFFGGIVRGLFEDKDVKDAISKFAQIYSEWWYRSDQAIRIIEFAIKKSELSDAVIGKGEREGWLNYFKTHNVLEDNKIENIINNKDNIRISDIFEQYRLCFKEEGNGSYFWRAVMSVVEMSTDWVATKEDVQELYEIILDIDHSLKEIER